jgi:hypothetical protein
VTALVNCVPNIELHKSKFNCMFFLDIFFFLFSQGFVEPLIVLFYADSWHIVELRKQFFVNFAKENNFDPQCPEHWYSHSKKIYHVKVHLLFSLPSLFFLFF